MLLLFNSVNKCNLTFKNTLSTFNKNRYLAPVTNNLVTKDETTEQLKSLLINPHINNMKFYFYFQTLLNWPYKYGYNLNNLSFFAQKEKQYTEINTWLHYKAEMLFRFAKRNSQVMIHMPRVPALVYRKHLLHREVARTWNNVNSSDMLFGFSAGRCGFRKNETKTFIATDTLISAGVWFITRFIKKLSPLKLRLMGNTNVFRKYLHRLTPRRKIFFKYTICSIEESTPIPFNGCKLSHYPRKRFRFHTTNFHKSVKYIKKYNLIRKVQKY